MSRTNSTPRLGAASAASFALVAGLLTVVHLKVGRPMLLLERFWPGAGWFEIAALAAYAAWLTPKMTDPGKARTWRPRAWRLFSLVFFGQLALGLTVDSRFLMTGDLHLPIPALIIAGPVFRMTISFMPILFLATVLLLGPAWCSHLCYVGAWDDSASRARRRPRPLPRSRNLVRVATLGATVVTALSFRLAGISGTAATASAAIFGLASLLIIAFWSTRSGQMVHCSMICPVGLVAGVLGRLNPFRLKIAPGCTDCGACRPSCRYDALRPEDIARRRPGISCTLCGDCLDGCPTGMFNMRFSGLAPEAARTLFSVLAVSLHAGFLGLARI